MNTTIKIIAVGLLLLGAVQTGLAQGQPAKKFEPQTSIETYTDRVLLPSSLSGRLQVSRCEACSKAVWQLDQNTRFNLEGRSVSLEEMAAYLRTAGSKPMTVRYRNRDSIVTKVSVK